MQNSPLSLSQVQRFFGAGFSSEGERRTVLNLIRLLLEDPDVQLFIREEDYTIGGIRRTDPRVIEGTGDRSLKITGVTSHQARLNFGIRTQQDVKLLGNRVGGKRGQPINARVHRTLNVIRDGELALPEIGLRMSEATFNKLVDAGLIPVGTTYAEARTYRIDLTGMPLVSRSWGQPGLLNLVSLMRDEQRLAAKQKALKRYVAKLPVGRSSKRNNSAELVYREKTSKVPGQPTTTYVVDTVEYRLRKFQPEAFAPGKLGRDAAYDLLHATSQELSVVRFKIRTIVFATEFHQSEVIPWDVTKRAGTDVITFKGVTDVATFDGAIVARRRRRQAFARSVAASA